MRLRKLKKLDSKSSEGYKTHDILHPKVFFFCCLIYVLISFGVYFMHMCVYVSMCIYIYNLTESLV